MLCKTRVVLAFTLTCLAAMAALAEPRRVSWDELSPDVTSEAVGNPFLTLSREQLADLRTLLRSQQAANTQSIDEARVDDLRNKLAAEGLDVDWLFEQRRLMMAQAQNAMRAANEDIIGADVRLPGYVLPLEVEGRKVVEFLLVPTVGACIHTPPPPANQMVRVVYPEGITVTGLFDPVWISGVMMSQFSRPSVGYIDGRMQVDVTYAMRPERVEPYSN